MIKIRYVVKDVEGTSSVIVAHPVGVQLPAIGDQAMVDFGDSVATLSIASQPQFEYEAADDETQKLRFVNYYATR